LIFSILFALQLDEYIYINYWLIFLPLFIWKMLVVFGACTGVFLWCKNGDHERIIRSPDNDCRALIIYFLLHILIFTFEILTCDKLENHANHSWLVCFIPLFICTLFSFLSCLWSLKVQRNFLVCLFLNNEIRVCLNKKKKSFRFKRLFQPMDYSFCFLPYD